LIEFLDPRERYSAARFAEEARRAIRDIHARGKRAIVVGGTGFYIRALTGDVALSDAFDPALRDRLAHELRLHEPEFLHGWLATRAPERAAQIVPTDRYRIVRALEIALATARSAPTPGAANAPAESNPHPGANDGAAQGTGLTFRKVVLDVDPAVLEERIAARVDAMLAGGFLAEAERIGPDAVAADAVGYPQALAFLAGYSTAEELRDQLIRATRRYAKRQRTWFRHEPETTVVSALGGLETLTRLARELPGWD
jgi:tRNA dimethylallyltransferase